MWFSNLQAACVHVARLGYRAVIAETPRSTCGLFVLGQTTRPCVYVWVKVRSVSAALVGTRRHLLCLPPLPNTVLVLTQTLTDTHTLSLWQATSFSLCDLAGWECGACHLSKVSASLHAVKFESCLCQLSLPPPPSTRTWAAWEINTSLEAGS